MFLPKIKLNIVTKLILLGVTTASLTGNHLPWNNSTQKLLSTELENKSSEEIVLAFNNEKISSSDLQPNLISQKTSNDTKGNITPYKKYYSNGQLLKEGAYDENGQKHGTWKKWDKYGILEEQYSYKNGSRHGLWQKWDSRKIGNTRQGILQIEGKWENGKRVGIWREWSTNEESLGEIIIEGTYHNGKREGVWKQWWPSRRVEHGYKKAKAVHSIKIQGIYQQGKLHGIIKNWSPKVVVLEGTDTHPVVVQETGGILMGEANYENGVKRGLLRTWDKYGKAKLEINCLNNHTPSGCASGGPFHISNISF